MRLYAVTDRTWLKEESLYEACLKALKGGVSFLQIREKNLDYEAYLSLSIQVRKAARAFDVPFVVNDDVRVAEEAGADGVHIGQSDTGLSKARQALGEDAIIGVSVQTLEQAITAQRGGADYLGVGAVFKTSTKKDALAVSKETLAAICQRVKIPVVAIGGIDEKNIAELSGCGLSGVAVVSALFAKEDIKGAACALKAAADHMAEGIWDR